MVGFFDKLHMYSFFINNKNNPEALAKYYFRHQRKIESLQKEYPDWYSYASKYPELINRLRELGVSI